MHRAHPVLTRQNLCGPHLCSQHLMSSASSLSLKTIAIVCRVKYPSIYLRAAHLLLCHRVSSLNACKRVNAHRPGEGVTQ